MKLMKIKSSEILNWVEMFNNHTKFTCDYDSIRLTALAYEKNLMDKFPDTDVFQHEMDSAFINTFKNDPFRIKTILENLIIVQTAIEDSFPLLGSLLQQFRKSVEEVRILSWQR